MKPALRRTVILFLVLAANTLAFAAFLPGPEKLTLKNGLTVFYLRSENLPLISLRMWIGGAGFANEAADLEGIASMASTLMLKGTADRNAESIADALDFMGARFSVLAGDEYASASGECLVEHFPKLMEIAADCLMNPAFREDEFIKEKKTRIDALRAAKDNPGTAVRYYFQKAYFGAHPMGHIRTGTETSLNRMASVNVKSHYLACYRPERSTLSVVGDMEKSRLIEVLNATVGNWRNPTPPSPLTPTPPAPKPVGKKLVLVDKPDATQAYWILGAPGYAVGDKETPQAAVMNTLFGGRFTSWLSTELRIKRGLTYGASSNFMSWSNGGLFSANSYTKNDKIGEMLDITLGLLSRARKEGFSVEEVTSSRNYIEGQFPPTLETNGSKAEAYVRLAFYSLGLGYYDRYLADIRNVTPAAAREAAVRWIPENDYVLVVVGKAAEIKSQLQKYGTWTEKKISDPDF
jgi:zinc protease